jgi:glutamyl-tRNA reductase
MSAPLVVIGADHRTSPVALRDRFAVVESDVDGALEALRTAGAREGVLIATCDRIELASHDERAVAAFAPLVASHTGIAPDTVAAALYRHEDEAALRHLFALSSALASAVIGEPHVLGQVRAAHRTASELGLVGPALESAFLGAFACARRVRRETGIAAQPVSIAAAALDRAREIHGDLDRCTALLLGPAEMGEMMAERFRGAGVARLVVCGPVQRAERAAARLACHHAPLEDLADALVSADIVISALGTGRMVLTPALLTATLRRRPRRPIFVIDAAVPPDADPAINALDGVFLYDLADLERVAITGRETRAAAAADAWRIVGDELAAFRARTMSRRAVPTVLALRQHFEAVRADVMAERGLDADAATRLLVNRLLHAPSEALRDLAGHEADAEGMESLVRRLFALPGAEDEG